MVAVSAFAELTDVPGGAVHPRPPRQLKPGTIGGAGRGRERQGQAGLCLQAAPAPSSPRGAAPAPALPALYAARRTRHLSAVFMFDAYTVYAPIKRS